MEALDRPKNKKLIRKEKSNWHWNVFCMCFGSLFSSLFYGMRQEQRTHIIWAGSDQVFAPGSRLCCTPSTPHYPSAFVCAGLRPGRTTRRKPKVEMHDKWHKFLLTLSQTLSLCSAVAAQAQQKQQIFILKYNTKLDEHCETMTS